MTPKWKIFENLFIYTFRGDMDSRVVARFGDSRPFRKLTKYPVFLRTKTRLRMRVTRFCLPFYPHLADRAQNALNVVAL